jgi:hypothetical protein
MKTEKQEKKSVPEEKDISFVVQGPVFGDVTKTCLQSLRKYMPEAEIVLSTYENSDVSALPFDRVVFSSDPGYFRISALHSYEGKFNNVNRQIVTTLAGLKASTRKYAFKIRSDFTLTGKGFLDFWNKFPDSEEEYKVFEKKLLACIHFTRNPGDENYRRLFHPSDMAFFGLTADLVKLFDIPLMKKEEESYIEYKGALLNKYTPEQHIFVNCLKKNGHDVDFCFMSHNNPKNLQDSERYFASNFIFLGWEKFNLKPSEKFNDPDVRVVKNFECVLTFVEWQALYKKYVNPSLQIPDEDDERTAISRFYAEFLKTKSTPPPPTQKKNYTAKNLWTAFKAYLFGKGN